LYILIVVLSSIAWHLNLDHAMVKSFPITHGPLRDIQKIDLRARIFNIFNHSNSNNPNRGLIALNEMISSSTLGPPGASKNNLSKPEPNASRKLHLLRSARTLEPHAAGVGIGMEGQDNVEI